MWIHRQRRAICVLLKEWKIVQCLQCSMVYLQNPASYEELEVDYSWDTTFLEEENRRKRKRGVFKNIAKLIRILTINSEKVTMTDTLKFWVLVKFSI